MLKEPFSIVISQVIADKYFGDSKALGEHLRLDGAHDFKITGILEEVKGNSQLNFNFLASYTSLESMGQYNGAWGQFGVDHNFILLYEGASKEEFSEKLPQVITENVNPGLAALIKLELQPFKEIYFHSKPGSQSVLMMNTMEENKTMDDGFLTSAIPCDFDFIDLFDIKILQGRNFSQEIQSDQYASVILNKAAVKQFGFKDPLGKKIMIPGANYELKAAEVIGVVDDFKFRTLKEKVSPLLLFYAPDNFTNLIIDFEPAQQSRLIEDIENIWADVTNDPEFQFSYLADDYAALYQPEMKMGQLFIFFSLLILFIACMGIFGLTSFMTEQRNKEIGIRKVLGAGVSGIIFNLTGSFLKWVLIANIIAIPISIFIMQKWLNNFSYKTEMDPWIFLTSAGLSVLIAFLTTSFQTYKAAQQDPAVVLKYE